MTPLLISLLAPTALAGGTGDAAVWFTWKKDDGAVMVLADGEHVAPDAPVSGWIESDGVRVDLETTGVALERGYPVLLNGKGGHTVTGALSLSLCEDGGTTCRMVELAFGGATDGRKGTVALGALVDGPAEAAPEVLNHSHDAEAAFAEAAASGKRVLLDFSAVWCPPCQVLAAEILHDPEEAGVLADFVVVELDADDPSSFALKSRYAVGGYPTVVVAEADGTLVDRMVGYPGEEGTREWLAATAGDILTIPELLASPESVPVEEAVDAAKRLLNEGEKEAASAMIERAADGVEKELVLFEMEPTLARLAQLMAAAPERAGDWIWGAYQLLSGVEAGELEPERKAVMEFVSWEMAGAAPLEASDYAYVAASLSEGTQAQAFNAAAAALLSAGLSGDPRLDRGHYTFLAHLYSAAGDPEGGLAVLEGAAEAFPEEFTYHYSAAGILEDEERYEEALAKAQLASEYAYGDMSIRAAMTQARILEAMERIDDARQVLTDALERVERPQEGEEVRTWTYIKRLEAQLAELDGDAAAE